MPWVPIALTLVIALSAAFPTDAIVDAPTGLHVDEAQLARSIGYIALAPLSNVLDTITLLAVPQHIALVLWALGLVALWQRKVLRVVACLVLLVLVYAAAAVLPRPMAQLSLNSPDILAIDFHTHTRYSHDGRSRWEPAKVREWHRAAGYDVAYVTDHATYVGAQEAVASNPANGADGTVLLPGIEAYYHGEHVNLLGAGQRFVGLTTADLVDIDSGALALASLISGSEPVLVETFPGRLSQAIPARGKGTAGVRAIELVDGSPRGLTQTRRDRQVIISYADQNNLALVAGSDNHGWGKAAPGWTLMRIPGWRGLTPDELDKQIERRLREGGRLSTRVVERRVPGLSTAGIIFGLPTIGWRMFTTMSGEERVMWVIWIWIAAIGCRMVERRQLGAAVSGDPEGRRRTATSKGE